MLQPDHLTKRSAVSQNSQTEYNMPSIEQQLRTAQAEVERLTQEKADLQTQINEHAVALETARSEIPEETASALKTAQTDCAFAQKELEEAKNRATVAENQCAALVADLKAIGISFEDDANAEEQRASAQAALAAHIATAAAAQAQMIVKSQGGDNPLDTEGGQSSGAANPRDKRLSDLSQQIARYSGATNN